ncbi:MAG: terminase [Chloroflexus sp.]|nr:MAG: terminase [Chloroflexus sp.]
MDKVMGYIEDVMNSRKPVNKFERLAVARHMRDLETAKTRGLIFDEREAARALQFFSLLKHSKGEWAGRTFELEGWQQFIVWVLFGWKREDGTRRFRTSYLEVARKNGKSTLAAGVGLKLFVADNEPGAEVYSVATKRDQARITHSEATRMVKASPALRKRVRVYRDNLNIEATASKFEPLGRDTDSLDGLNIHGVIVDELHAHKSRDLVDVLETARGARRQPLQFEITTAGYDRESICFEHHEYTEKILTGVVEDDTWFGVIFTIDPEDDWNDEAVWVKANPNLGVSKKVEYMREQAKRAREMPSQLNAFLRLDLDVWTQSETKWVNLEHWRACGEAVDGNGLRGRRCYAGLDLSSTTDVSALVYVFPPEDAGDTYKVLCRFWIPEEAMHERSRRDRVPYEAWVRQGYMTATPGNVIDYDYIIAQIDDDMQNYDVQELAFDRWGATKIVQELQEMGLTVVQFGQGFASMSAPMKELEKLILSHKLAHSNNPVLTWMADNLVAAVDPAGNIKPDKQRSIEKIDGMVALIMALDRALRHGDFESVYGERGILML